jgi:hypothetical protein
VLPKKIENWPLTSLQQRLVKTGGAGYQARAVLLGDSGEAEHRFRREAERHSGVNRTPSERSDAGTLDYAKSVRLRQGDLSDKTRQSRSKSEP